MENAETPPSRLTRDPDGYLLDGRVLTCGDKLVLRLYDHDEVVFFDLEDGTETPILLLRGRGDVDVLVRLTENTPVAWPAARRKAA